MRSTCKLISINRMFDAQRRRRAADRCNTSYKTTLSKHPCKRGKVRAEQVLNKNNVANAFFDFHVWPLELQQHVSRSATCDHQDEHVHDGKGCNCYDATAQMSKWLMCEYPRCIPLSRTRKVNPATAVPERERLCLISTAVWLGARTMLGRRRRRTGWF